jgi:hypothetical protein
VYVIINETSEEFDDNNNPIINPQNLGRGAKYRAEGETDATIPARVIVRLIAAEWETIKAAFNHGGVLPQIRPRTYLWDTNMPYIGKENVCSRREVKLDKGANQSVQQASY